MIRELEPHEARVVEETAALKANIVSLTNFIDGPNWDKVNPIQKSLLHAQLAAMTTYHIILQQRIKSF